MSNKSFYLMLPRKRYECAILWRKAGNNRFEHMDMEDVTHYIHLANKLNSISVKLP